MKNYLGASAVLVALLFVPGTNSRAEPFLEIESEAYNVRLVNELGVSVRVKFVGARPESNFSHELRPGESVTRDFYAGDRMLGAWNERNQLVFQAAVRVDRSGRLRLRNYHAVPYAAREGDREPAAAKSGALEIEKE